MQKIKRIVITSNDINNGECNNGNHCPIALSAKRAFKTDDIEVYTEKIRIKDYYYRLPKRAKEFILEFDSEPYSVMPFNFSLAMCKLAVNKVS